MLCLLVKLRSNCRLVQWEDEPAAKCGLSGSLSHIPSGPIAIFATDVTRSGFLQRGARDLNLLFGFPTPAKNVDTLCGGRTLSHHGGRRKATLSCMAGGWSCNVLRSPGQQTFQL